MSSDASFKPIALTTRVTFAIHWLAEIADKQQYGGIRPWIFLYMYYFWMGVKLRMSRAHDW
jgi:hypothetical protein